MSKVKAGWDAALEWAARMIETGYPNDAPTPAALAMTLRARRGEIDSQLVAEAVARHAYERWRSAAAHPVPEGVPND